MLTEPGDGHGIMPGFLLRHFEQLLSGAGRQRQGCRRMEERLRKLERAYEIMEEEDGKSLKFNRLKDIEEWLDSGDRERRPYP